MKQMIEVPGINLKSTSSPPKRKLDRKLSVGLLVVGLLLAAFLYWRYLNHLTHTHVAAKAASAVPAFIAPATGKPELAASSPKSVVQPATTNTDNQFSAKAAAVGFADSLMSVISPSAKAETIPREMPLVRTLVTETARPVKRIAIPPAALPALRHKLLQPTTAEQQRLKVVQDGFGDIINMAYKYPDSYGFMPDENINDATLGDPIPIFTITPQDGANYAGQPVKSLLKPTDEWIYPIILENRIRFMMQVRYVGHDYVLGHGSRALAMVYEKILARWPSSEGFHPQLVVNPNMTGYFFTIPELPDQNITDTDRMFDFNPSLSPATVILASWQ
jgi:hypothetical protein